MTKENDQIFVQTGGARIGRSFWFSWNYTVPFANLSMTNTTLNLSVSVFTFIRSYNFEKCQISSVKKFKGLFSSGIRIDHDLAQYPPFIVFWSRDCDELEEKLKVFGYFFSH